MSLLRRFLVTSSSAFLLAAAGAAMAIPASAQTSDAGYSQPNLVPVMIWTLVVALLAMLTLSLGYLYRRARGAQDEVIPKTVEPFNAAAGHEDAHGAAVHDADADTAAQAEAAGGGHAA